MGESRPVSVVISALNEGVRLSETVDSIIAAKSVPAEIIVVDDGSTDGCADGLADRDRCRVRLRVHHREHAGIAPARNFGAGDSGQPILVFLDAHCSVAASWLDPLLDILREDPATIAIPTMANSQASHERGCGAQIVDDMLAYRWVAPMTSAAEVGVAPGGCFAIRRDTFARIGSLGALADFGFEDVEFSFRAWRLGVAIVGTPQSVVTHDFRRTAPYPRNNKTWLANIIVTALLHLDGDDQRRTLQAAAGYSLFANAVIDVLNTGWRHRRAWIDTHAVRDMAGYWSRFPRTRSRLTAG